MSTLQLNAQHFQRLSKLMSGSYRPPEIMKLREQIESETRTLKFRTSFTNVVDNLAVMRIVAMKHQLDSLYLDWVEGRLK